MNEQKTTYCPAHTGFDARLHGLEDFRVEQRDTNSKLFDKTDAIFTRLNVVLGGIVVAVVLLAINLALKGFT